MCTCYTSRKRPKVGKGSWKESTYGQKPFNPVVGELDTHVKPSKSLVMARDVLLTNAQRVMYEGYEAAYSVEGNVWAARLDPRVEKCGYGFVTCGWQVVVFTPYITLSLYSRRHSSLSTYYVAIATRTAPGNVERIVMRLSKAPEYARKELTVVPGFETFDVGPHCSSLSDALGFIPHVVDCALEVRSDFQMRVELGKEHWDPWTPHVPGFNAEEEIERAWFKNIQHYPFALKESYVQPRVALPDGYSRLTPRLNQRFPENAHLRRGLSVLLRDYYMGKYVTKRPYQVDEPIDGSIS